MRSCYKYNFENMGNYFLMKAGTRYWKDKNKSQIIQKSTEVRNIIQKLHLNKKG